MQPLELIRLFVEPLEKADFEYMVTGSVATIFYGEPRLTNDVDLVVAIQKEQADAFAALFGGPDFYCPPAEVIAIEAGRLYHSHFNLIHSRSGYKADIYPVSNSFERWGLQRKKRLQLEEMGLWVAPEEYVILMKMEYYSEGGSDKHLSDIRGVLSMCKDLDLAFIRTQAEAMGLSPVWKRIETKA